MIPCFNDIWIFETRTLAWSKLEGSGIPPKKRMNHAASILGSLLLIHGGYNNEGTIVYSDFNLFDIEENKWIKTRVIIKGKVIDSEAVYGSTVETDDSDASKHRIIGPRRGHCLVGVYN